ncbi:hypothetical protein HK405_006104 [Cladochytrium tenue]|nr:hypothetical protein HK405_006104 [Cladochytrium tenue]
MAHRPSVFEAYTVDRIKPLCSEELWWSLEDPDTLDAAYKLSKVDDNISSYYGSLFELIFEIVYLYQPEVIASLQGNIHKKERDLDRRLDAWLESLPPKYWIPLDEECPSEHDLEHEDPTITELGSADGVSSILKLEVAFNTGVDASLAISRCLGALLKSGLGSNLIPRFTLYFCVQGALTAVMSRGFVRGSTMSLLMAAAKLSDNGYEQAISHYFRFLATISSAHGAGSDAVGEGSVLLRFLDAFHRDDWPVLDAITAAPDSLLNRLPDNSNNPSEDYLRPSMPPPSRIAAFSASLRDLVAAVRVARTHGVITDRTKLDDAAGPAGNDAVVAAAAVSPRQLADDLLSSLAPAAPDPAHAHILMDWLFAVGFEQTGMQPA